MVTNLPREALHKWREVALAKRPEEKIRKLQEFLSLVPKHKGTESLRNHSKRKIASLKEEIVDKKRKKTGVGRSSFFVEKEGDTQIVILGFTNVGRSSIISILTNAKIEISSYPYTTKEPTPGMFQYQDLQFQLVEAPALIENAADGGTSALKTLTVARNADALLLMVDLSKDPVKQYSLISKELEKSRILTRKPKGKVEIERTYKGAGLKIIIVGRLLNSTFKEIEELLKSYGIYDATVKIQGEATADDVEDAIFEGTVYRPTILIANKTDHPNATQKIEQLKKFIGDEIKILPTSCKTKNGLEKLGSEIFGILDIIRIYTKEPNKRSPSKKPFTTKVDSTILDLAKKIHSDFYKQFSYAKIWAKRLRFSPQKVGGNFILEDGDIVELHMR
ncbi:50S ribosome-binding GTPase [Candidatus Bathyarchaeota archaeon]|nr:50S ribosome-binding GTPase [Candidatus Bathyarchaeota archaeon]